jgi:hypothetical protein
MSVLVRSATAIAALLTATAITPALAISIDVSASHSGGTVSGTPVDLDAILEMTADDISVVASTFDSAATGSVAADVWGNVALVVDLIESSDWTAHSVAGLAVTQAAAIAVNDAANTDARATLDAALGVYASEIGGLQAALAGNTSLRAWLDAQGIAFDSVIAADITAEGSLTVYTD